MVVVSIFSYEIFVELGGTITSSLFAKGDVVSSVTDDYTHEVLLWIVVTKIRVSLDLERFAVSSVIVECTLWPTLATSGAEPTTEGIFPIPSNPVEVELWTSQDRADSQDSFVYQQSVPSWGL